MIIQKHNENTYTYTYKHTFMKGMCDQSHKSETVFVVKK